MRDIPVKHARPRLLMIIVAREAEDDATRLIRKCHVPLHFQCVAQGTAASEMLEMMGLDDADKTLMVCIAAREPVERLLVELRRNYRLMAPGRGIAFSVPISGISSPVMRLVDSETRERIKEHMEREVEKVTTEAEHELILAVINQGYSDELMAAAKGAGAQGGTIVHARRVGMEDTLKLWGISVQEEKELILIVAPKEGKAEIMRAIGRECGLTTPAQGFALSVPVDGVAGIEEA